MMQLVDDLYANLPIFIPTRDCSRTRVNDPNRQRRKVVASLFRNVNRVLQYRIIPTIIRILHDRRDTIRRVVIDARARRFLLRSLFGAVRVFYVR